MSEQHYNVVLTGELTGDTPVADVRPRLKTHFKLDDDALAHQLSGRASIVKRDVDLRMAVRIRDALLAAGADAIIEALNDRSAAPDEAPPAPEAATEPDAGSLALAPARTAFPQPEDPPPAEIPDISAIGLVVGDDWTLEDCQPPPPAPLSLDLDHLSVEPRPAETPQVTPPRQE
jgi:hypothetical protein